jgi:hypothetical protein
MILVGLAGISPAFADGRGLIFTPPAACPGERVTFPNPIVDDVVGGGIGIAAVSPLLAPTLVSVDSDPVGLVAVASPECSVGKPTCTFVISESARCGHYTVTVTFEFAFDGRARVTVYGPFDVPATCCSAVGGCVQPVNAFTLLSPWLAAIGIVGCIGTAVVIAKKRST